MRPRCKPGGASGRRRAIAPVIGAPIAQRIIRAAWSEIAQAGLGMPRCDEQVRTDGPLWRQRIRSVDLQLVLLVVEQQAVRIVHQLPVVPLLGDGNRTAALADIRLDRSLGIAVST